jgi:hypothetical protein
LRKTRKQKREETMTSLQGTAEGIPPGVGLLDRERIIARPGFNRWLVPPAAKAWVLFG